MSQCDAFGLVPTQAAAEVRAVIAVVNNWRTHFAQAGVTAGDIASLAEHLDGDALLSQRSGFHRTAYRSSPAKRVNSSPFRPS